SRVQRAANEKLRAFVDSGGGLIIFGGDLVDVAEFNATMYDAGRGLAPLPIAGVAEAPAGADAVAIASWDASHPALRAFDGPTADLLRQVRIDAYLRVESPPAGEDTSSSTAVVIASTNDAYQSPLIVEKAFGRGRTIFIATSADQEWNDWASNFSYLPFVLETTQYVARPTTSQRDVLAGETLRCEVDPHVVEPSVGLRTPAYPTDPEIRLNAEEQSPRRGDAAQAASSLIGEVRFGDTEHTGRYEFLLKRLSGGTIRRFASVNPDPTESDLAPAATEALRGASDTLRVEVIDDLATLANAADRGRTEFWWPLLLMVAATMMVEQGLAWRFGSRG
ncbi:MAG: hypothetical protein KDA33_17385, partial [Phycisphaerales bacterium]|nr:hypothetical protein [Phycisphaerales bacterium]